MVDPQDDDPEDGGGGGEDHHGGVVDAEDGRVVRGGDPRGHRHQEHLKKGLYVSVTKVTTTYRHVEHGGDAQRDLLPRLRGDQEHEPSQQPLSNLGTLHSFCCENKSFKMCNSSETFPRLLTTFAIVEVKCEVQNTELFSLRVTTMPMVYPRILEL